MSAVLAFALVVTGCWLARVLLSWLRVVRLTRSLPGPPAYPLVGSFPSLAGSQALLYDRVMALSARYGPIFKVWLGPVLAVVVADPDDLQVVLTGSQTQRKAEIMYSGSIEPFTGKGLVTLNGKDYQRHRRAVTPGFHAEVLNTFLPTFQAGARRLCDQLCDQLSESAGCGPVDVAPLCGTCTAEAVCETVLSGQPDPERTAFATATFKSAKLLFYRAMRPWLSFDPIFYWSRMYTEYIDITRVAHRFVSKVLHQKLTQLSAPAREPPPVPAARTVLDHLLTPSSGKTPRLDQNEILGELKNILWAGATTTADALSFLVYCLALRPDLQRRAQEELEEVAGERAELQAADLSRLHYLECIIKEVLRYFPPSPVFAREPGRDVLLPSGHVLPAGCVVLVAPIITHKDPRHFPDPHAFDPDRFLPEQERARHQYAYLPFSAGSRSCPSKRFAILYLKTVVASLLRSFDFSADPQGVRRIEDIKPLLGTGLHVSEGARVMVHRRGQSTPLVING